MRKSIKSLYNSDYMGLRVFVTSYGTNCGRGCKSEKKSDTSLILTVDSSLLENNVFKSSTINDPQTNPFNFIGEGLIIDWGDGQVENYKNGVLIHSYSKSGVYTIKIIGYITKIMERAFLICDGLTNLIIPNSVITIDNYAFKQCYNLKEVVILDGVQSIGRAAFDICRDLLEVIIPNSVTNLDEFVFNSCYKLSKVTFKGINPPSSQSNTWGANYTMIPKSCKFYVPTGSLSAYTSAENYPNPNTYTYIEY